MNRTVSRMLLPLAMLIISFKGGIADEAQEQFDRNLDNAREASERLQQEREREQMRDRSHDFPRIRIDDNTSVGGSVNPPGVNVRRTTE